MHHIEPLGAALAGDVDPGPVPLVRITRTHKHPAPYARLDTVNIEDPAFYSTGVNTGVPRFHDRARVVLPHPQGDRVGVVLHFASVDAVEDFGRVLLALAATARQTHDPQTIRALWAQLDPSEEIPA